MITINKFGINVPENPLFQKSQHPQKMNKGVSNYICTFVGQVQTLKVIFQFYLIVIFS